MEVQTFACDICQTQKKAANHWFRGFRLPQGVLITEWDVTAGSVIRGLEEPHAHLCGADCVTQWLSKNLL